MGISGTDHALMYAQAGVARAGATRAGYTSPSVFVAVNGVQYATGRSVEANAVIYDSVTIEEILNDIPNTCTFAMRGAEPAEGAEVIITLGSINNLERQFAGTILNRSHSYIGVPANWRSTVNAIDYTWLLTRRQFSGFYTNTSATAIANAIVAVVPDVTSGVVADLPVVDEFSVVNTDAMTALTQLAKRIGGSCDVDYHKVVKLFITDTSVTNPTTLTSTHPSLSTFAFTRDLGQIRTRMLVEGGGVQALLPAAVGDTVLAVEDAAWYNQNGGFVVSGPQHILYTGIGVGGTTDVADWQGTEIPVASQDWDGICWSPDVGLFVAMAATSDTAAVMTSPDGINWTTRTPAANSNWHDVVWAPALSLFAAISSNGLVMTSPDGVTWTSRTASSASKWVGITWSPALSLFVVVANILGVTDQVMTSPDGINWTTRTAAAALDWERVTWSPSLGLFAAVASGTNTNPIMTSPDGTTWTRRTATALGFAIAWSPTLSLFVTVGSGNAMSSPDGITWTARTPAEVNTWRGLTWTDSGWFVAVANTGTNRIMASDDGVTWGAYFAPGVGLWRAVAWGSAIGTLVAVGITGASTQIMVNITVTHPTLVGVPASGAGSIRYPILQGDPVHVLAQVDDLAAQATLATLFGGDDDGVVEGYFQDDQISETEATARGTAQLALSSTALVTIRYKSRDVNTRPGRTISVNLGSPTNVMADFTIQRVTIDSFQPARYPTFTVEASTMRFSLEDLLRLVHDNSGA